MGDEIFESTARSSGDLAGVFEYDGETGYFYLYQTTGSEGQKVLDSIHILSAEPDFTESDLTIRWDSKQERVGLFIRGELWAVFDSRKRTKHGGNYRADVRPSLPPEVVRGFSS
jgi:hypothetical protein